MVKTFDEERSVNVGDMVANYKRVVKHAEIHNALENDRLDRGKRVIRRLYLMPRKKRIL